MKNDVGERWQVLHEWNETRVPLPSACIQELFEAQVERDPSAIAVIEENEELTYGELNCRANQLARYLHQQDVRPGECVPIIMPRCLKMLVAQLAVLKNGCAYVPMDPLWPKQRQVWMLRDCGARRAIVADAGVIARLLQGPEGLSHDAPQWVDLTAAGPRIRACSDANPVPQGNAESVANVIYTSGSTGLPKGVMVPHRAIVRLVINNGFIAVERADCVAHCSNPTFDASTFEIWVALLNGARLCVVPQAVLLKPQRLCELLLRQRVTVLLLITGVFHQYGEVLGEVFKRLRYLLVGGDVLHPGTIARVLRDSPPANLLNAYGPTECATIATTHRIEAVDAGDPGISIGRPIANTRIYILDDYGEPVPVGVGGEIHIGGAAVALGYLNREALTAERFLADPFNSEESARMFRTGDQGRWRADGTIEFLGRDDFQVKIRGFRIELGEIEARLSQYPGVHEAAVLAREDDPRHKRLVAYFTVEETAATAVSVSALKSHLAQVLPHYMLPSAFVVLDRFPLTANGKLDRKALPAPDMRNASGIEYLAPATGWEEEVAGVWVNVLKVERVGRNDGFSSLGGTSIQAIEASFQFGRKYARGGQVSAPIGNTTLAEYAEILRGELKQHRGDGEHTQPPLLPSDHRLASHAQQQVWFLEQMGDASRAYRFDARFDLRGRLDVDALKAALNALLARHEIFRTAFLSVEGRLERRIETHTELDLRCVDLASLPDAERPGAQKDMIAAEVSREFSTERAPLIRWLLLRLSETEHVLVHSEHHYLHDGQSFRILVRDLAALYNAARRGGDAGLPEIEAQYSEFCAQEHRQFAAPQFQRKLAEWTQKLSALKGHERLFADRQSGGERRFLGTHQRRGLSEDLAVALENAAARLGLSRFSFMMSAFGLICSRYAGCKKFLIGTALANRTSAKYQWTIGMFVNMLPIPFDCDPGLAFDRFARTVSCDIDFALARTEVPVSEIVTRMGMAATLKGEPPFSVGFSFHDSMALTTDFEELDVGLHESISNGSAKFDLDVVGILGAHGKSIELIFEYDTDRFDHDIIERMMNHYCMLLEELAIDPNRRLRELQLLTHDERQDLLLTGVNLPMERPAETSIPRLFELQAAKRPDAIALLADGRELTYRELNSRANRLGHYLKSQGVGPEVAVVVCMDRSVELIVSLLGIWKAGGVYVPVGADCTEERLERALTEVDASVLLTLEHLGHAIQAGSRRTVYLDADWHDVAQHPPTPLVSQVQPANLAYCIFTSGSTGTPKGVGVSMQSLVNHAGSHMVACDITSMDRVLQICSPGFDASLEEIVPTLIAGATLVLAPRDFKAADEEFLQWLDDREITVMDIPTALWSVLTSYMSAERRTSWPASLRALIIGGEAARWEHVDAMLGLGSPCRFRLFNTYGPTETTIVATRGVVDLKSQPRRGGSPSEPRNVPLGRAIPNARIYVLDDDLTPVPIGVKGQIYIAGSGVARGYWRRPDLTAERFLPDPFAQPGERMYCSGDFGRYLPDGQVEFLGRVDNQVKISGFRVDPEEVEAALLRLAGIRQAAVIAWSPDGRDMRLAAYVVADPSSSAARELWRKELLRFLPDYMVPTTWSFLDSLPLNQNGKVDRKSLLLPVLTGTEPVRAPIMGTPQVELYAVLDILQELLPGVSIAPADDLFAKGMHSLLVLRLMSRCRERLGIKIKVRDLYALASPLALADHIHEARMSAA